MARPRTPPHPKGLPRRSYVVTTQVDWEGTRLSAQTGPRLSYPVFIVEPASTIVMGGRRDV